jgi:Ca2+/Na+ antiporter
MKLVSIVGLVILIGTINLFLYRLNENFFYSLVLFDITLCLYFYNLSFLSLTTLPVIALTGLLILFIGWVGYLTYKTWMEENDKDGISEEAERSKLYWIYLPVVFFSLFLIMFVWTLSIANSEVKKSEFLKRRKQDKISSPKSPNETPRISLNDEFSNQCA